MAYVYSAYLVVAVLLFSIGIGRQRRTIQEAVDLIYHLFVMLYSKNITYNEIEKEIIKRKNVRR